MLNALAVLALVLFQEPVRLQENAQAKQRQFEADQHYRAGVDALQTERYEEAEEELRKAVKLDPDSYLAYFSLGKTYIALKDYDRSVQAYLSCQGAWDRSVAEAMKQGFDQESRQEDRIRELRDRKQEQETLLSAARSDMERMQIQTRIENIRLGIDSIERMRNRNRGLPDPPAEFSFALGSAYLRRGSIPEAEQAYLDALKLRPKYGEAHNNLAIICIKREDYEGAYTHAKAAQKAGFKVHPQLMSDIEEGRRKTRK